MGGLQQLDKLIRKNVLLKVRHPKRACCELALPLVLFTILALVRTEYESEIRYVGPGRFHQRPIFPQRRLLNDIFEEHQEYSGHVPQHGGKGFGSWLKRELLCHQSSTDWAGEQLEPVLSLNLSLGGILRSRTLADEVLQLDAAKVSEAAHELVHSARVADVGELASLAEHAQREYLGSEWARQVETASESADAELAALWADLRSTGAGNSSAVSRLQQWLGDACLSGDLMLSWNATRLAQDLMHLWSAVNRSGLRSLLSSARQLLESTQTGGGQLAHPDHGGDQLPTQTTEEISSAEPGSELMTRTFSGRGLTSQGPIPSTSPGTRATWWQELIWWASHFATPGSPVSMALQLGNDLAARGAGAWPASAAGRAGPGAEPGAAGEGAASAAAWLREVACALGLPAGGGQGSSPSADVVSLLEALDSLTGLNATAIEREVLPAWRQGWRAQCRRLNSTKVAESLLRAWRLCPACLSDIKAAAELGPGRHLDSWLRSLRRLNVSSLARTLQRAQAGLRRLDAPRFRDGLRRVLLRAQERAGEERSSPRSVARQLAGALRQELLGGLSATTCGGEAGAGTFPWAELLRRKLLVAPYRGEVKDLWDLVLVELVMDFTSAEDAGDQPSWKSLLSNPLLQGITAKGLETIVSARTLTFATEQELEKFALDHPRDVLAAIVFRSADELTGDFQQERLEVRYTVRMHAQLVPSTARILARSGAPRTKHPYFDIGFVYLQETIGRATARLRAGREAAAAAAAGRGGGGSEIERNMRAQDATALLRRLHVSAEQFPSPRVKVDTFMNVVKVVLPLFTITAWVFCVCWFVKQMVYEKEERLREVMRIHGLRTWVYWASWVIFAMAQLTAVASVVVAILHGSGLLQHSDPAVIFAFLLVSSGAVVSFVMLISACFSSAKMAAVFAGIAYYSAYLPFVALMRYEEAVPLAAKCALCLLCPAGAGAGMSLIARWELAGEGLQWSNLHQPPPAAGGVGGFSVAHVTAMLCADVVIYQTLAWYVEKIFPGQLGLAQPWYFPLLPSYWRRSSNPAAAQRHSFGPSDEEADNALLECYEAAPPDLKVLVRIGRLAKTFPGGRRALKGISLDMHEGTIMGLLGHNGAGKSTTMSILTGLFPPSEGDVIVNGCSVSKDSRGVRQQLGVCLQRDALYDALTVEEHLDLFCNLKSVPRRRVPAEVDALLRDTGLEAKRSAFTYALSGGTKRKLSIGMALAGGSKVVALDEPTAGVDATSRRDIWQLLAAHKQHRAILLSTHFLDEADVLSDRIAIIAEGQLTAIGSSIGLKKCFADRYLLTIVASDRTDPGQLLAAVRAVVPEAACAGSRGREFSFALPNSARPCFAGLLSSLQDDELRDRLGVETYGISAATMEEVFLMASSVHEEGLRGVVRNGAEVDNDAACVDDSSTHSQSSQRSCADTFEKQKRTPANRKSSEATMSTSAGGCDSSCSISDRSFRTEGASEVADTVDSGSLLTGTPLLAQQFRARLWTRARSASRDRRAWASQILLPLCFVLMAMIIGSMFDRDDEDPALRLTTNMFIGAASGSRTPLHQNQIPFENARRDTLGAWLETAFEAAKGADDVLLPSTSGPVRSSENGTTALWQYIMNHSTELQTKSYGAVSVGGQGEIADVTLWYNNLGIHTVPAMVHMLNNARFKLLGYSDTSTEAWTQPLPKTQRLVGSQLTSKSKVFASLIVAITVVLAMGFIPASFLVYLVNEKATKTKHQQMLVGVSPLMYWTSSYCWDLINCCMSVALAFALFSAFQLDVYSGRNAMAVLMLLLSYSGAMTPQTYCLEPLFEVPSAGYVTCIVLNIFTGTVSILTTALIDMAGSDVPHLQHINPFLKAILPWLLPNYSLGQGLIEVAKNHYIRFAAEEFGTCMLSDPTACSRDSLDWNVAGRYVFGMFVMSGVWFVLRLVIEWRYFLRVFRRVSQEAGRKSGEEDGAVGEESARVNRAVQDWSSRCAIKDSLLVHNLSKNFERVRWRGCRRQVEIVHSVKGISMAVEGGECFGLLGVNGAGKTTTMRMITGDIEVGGGDVLLSGWSVRTHLDQARRQLGYCPQFDALADKLTAREALHFYARIRGVPAGGTKALVDAMVGRMCLEAHQHRLCEHLSGGNKRKLSTALALIGEPSVVLLDEPSTGVDVGARRFLWDVLGNARQQGLALVLTSHSMEECEVLCTRLTVMVSGEMRCLGTPQQLKARYGGGYTLALKLRRAREENEHVREFVKENMPMARLTEESLGLFRYRLGGAGGGEQEAPLAEVFGALEGAMAQGGLLEGRLLDYTLSQTTLEEVFLHFSRLQQCLEERGHAEPEP